MSMAITVASPGSVNLMLVTPTVVMSAYRCCVALKRGRGAHSVAPEMGSASPRRAVGSGVPGGGVGLVGADVRLDHGLGDVVTWRCRPVAP
jgi:hypothetical protein